MEKSNSSSSMISLRNYTCVQMYEKEGGFVCLFICVEKEPFGSDVWTKRELFWSIGSESVSMSPKDPQHELTKVKKTESKAKRKSSLLVGVRWNSVFIESF